MRAVHVRVHVLSATEDVNLAQWTNGRTQVLNASN
eukprot:SAG31_NODE_42612_length_270_cov_2.093567_1_plen_34_part_10